MRITNEVRGLITAALIERGFNERTKELNQRKAALADRIYRMIIPKELEDLADALERKVGEIKPLDRPTWLSQVAAVDVRDADYHYERFEMNHKRPYWERFISIRLADITDADLRAEVDKAVADQEALGADITVRRNEISAILAQATTPAKLRQIWPDVMPVAEPILEKAGMDPKPQLPAIDVTVLNNLLDLPPQEPANDETTGEELAAA